MQNDYDHITAYHYSAYRSALHLPILERCLKGESFNRGLDVGCGTGQSSVALANFCNKIIGLEPSYEMLEKTIFHPKVNYLYLENEKLPFHENSFDIITFAGSWYYTQSQMLLKEVIRIAK